MNSFTATFLAIFATAFVTACASPSGRSGAPSSTQQEEEQENLGPRLGEAIASLRLDLAKARARQYDVVAPEEMRRLSSDLRRARYDFRHEARARRSRSMAAALGADLRAARADLESARRTFAAREDILDDVLSARGCALMAGARRQPESAARLALLDRRFKRLSSQLDRRRDAVAWALLSTDYKALEVTAVEENVLGEVSRHIEAARRGAVQGFTATELATAERRLHEARQAIQANPRRRAAYMKAVERATRQARLLTGELAAR